MINTNKINREYGKWLGSMNWNLYITITYNNGCSQKMNRYRMNKFFEKNKKTIEDMFFVSERHYNYKDVHSHILVNSSKVSELKRNTLKMRSYCDVDFREIDNTITTDDGKTLCVGYYVSKFLSYDVDYGILDKTNMVLL